MTAPDVRELDHLERGRIPFGGRNDEDLVPLLPGERVGPSRTSIGRSKASGSPSHDRRMSTRYGVGRNGAPKGTSGSISFRSVPESGLQCADA